jgi:hypothetical protein
VQLPLLWQQWRVTMPDILVLKLFIKFLKCLWHEISPQRFMVAL